ncbi:MAG: DUF1992 domain-containing protein [Chloroflexota bacterium]|nr:DUF1992 domain-containing protein [Chloroflexota bacterium]
MKKWERIVDRLAADAIGDGDVSHLSGAGKKLALSADSSTPDELRAAFKIMRDHNVMPDWIDAGARLEQSEAKLKRQIQAAARTYQRQISLARAKGKQAMRETAEQNWYRNKEAYLEGVDRYNREALAHNLTLPSGIPHKRMLQGEAMIKQALADDS